MHIQYCSDYIEMGKKALERLIGEIAEKRMPWIGTATGSSPKGLYGEMTEYFKENPDIFKDLGIVKLDEWGGIPMDAPNTCETYVREMILKPMQVSPNRYIGFRSDPDDPEEECRRIQNKLNGIGLMDVCILGLGKNGHIAFNEPSDALAPHCHRAKLSKESQQHQMVDSLTEKPSYGLTFGMGDILRSKTIILLVSGNGKEAILRELLKACISTLLPASFLWIHPNVYCYIDRGTVRL